MRVKEQIRIIQELDLMIDELLVRPRMFGRYLHEIEARLQTMLNCRSIACNVESFDFRKHYASVDHRGWVPGPIRCLTTLCEDRHKAEVEKRYESFARLARDMVRKARKEMDKDETYVEANLQ